MTVTKKKKNEYTRVEILWIDSRGITSEWEFLEEIEPMLPCEVQSIGFLLEDKKNYVTIAQSMSRDQVLGRMSIPKACIKKMKK